MHSGRIRALIALIALSLSASSAVLAAKVKVRAQHDPKFDFRSARTWNWARNEPGVVKMLRTQDDDSEDVRRRFEPTIMGSFEEEIGRRGLSVSTSGAPDLEATYYLLVTIGTESQVAGQFLPAVADWGIPPFAPSTTSFKIIQQGSLVLDFKSTKLNEVVWRGVAQAEIDQLKSDEERKVRIRDAVRDLLRQYPPKK
jgi:hypothetical protein